MSKEYLTRMGVLAVLLGLAIVVSFYMWISAYGIERQPQEARNTLGSASEYACGLEPQEMCAVVGGAYYQGLVMTDVLPVEQAPVDDTTVFLGTFSPQQTDEAQPQEEVAPVQQKEDKPSNTSTQTNGRRGSDSVYTGGNNGSSTSLTTTP